MIRPVNRGNSAASRAGRRITLSWLALVLLSICGSGAACPNLVAQYQRPQMPVLPAQATLEDVITLVNENSARVESLYSTDAKISAPWFPTLKARLAFHRPQRLRLLARTSLSGPEIDLGSNDEAFWVWIARSNPPQTYFCRHDQFAMSPLRRSFPIEPGWLVDALGVGQLAPIEEHHGPTPREDGNLEVRTVKRGPFGNMTKVTVLDATHGWVIEQSLYDERGVLVASAAASEHRRDPISQAVLPAKVELEWPAAKMSLRLDLGDVQINSDEALAETLWNMPSYEGYELVNLADPSLFVPAPQAAGRTPKDGHATIPASATPTAPNVPHTASQIRDGANGPTSPSFQ